MSADLIDGTRDFDVVKAGAVVTVNASRLSIRKQRMLQELVRDKAKAVVREEYVAASRLIPDKERVQFLVQASAANADPDPGRLQQLQESVWCLAQTLVMGCSCNGKVLDYDGALDLIEADPETADLIRYHCLGIDVDELMKVLKEQPRPEEAAATPTFPG